MQLQQQIIDNISSIIEQKKAEIESQRIYYYAKSLTLPWDSEKQLPIGDEGRPWEYDFGEHGKITIPYAHLRQRYMTYPYEDKEALWKLCISIFNCAFAGNQFGKAQPVWSKVLTPDGWREIGDLEVGDEIFTSDGTITKIKKIFPQGIIPVFGFKFDDKSLCFASSEHLWQVKLPHGRFRDGQSKIMSTKELIEYRNKYPKYGKHISIPTIRNLNFPKTTQPIHPYVLGLLLGDGALSNSSVRFTTVDKELVLSIGEVGGFKVSAKMGNGEYFIGGAQPIIRLLGLSGKRSWEKYIPEAYLYAPDEDRLAILRGLMDTDGTIGKKGWPIEFSTTSEQLAKDVQFLVQSFGGKATIRERTTQFTSHGIKKNGRLSYRVHIRIPINPFWLRRKSDRYTNGQETYDRVIRDIYPVGDKECVCINIDHPSGLYITDNCIITHNSVWLAAWIIMESLGIHPLQQLTWKDAMILCGKDELPEGADPNATIRPKPPVEWWVVGTELPSEARIKGGEDTALVKTFYEWTPSEEIKFYRKDKIMTIGDSVVKWFSHDQESRKLKGARVDGIGWDEEPPKSFWNEGRPRIIKKKGIFLLAMTSDYGSWTGEIRRQKKNPSYYIGEFDNLDNPFMPEAHRKLVIGSMNEQEQYMRRFGKDITFKGKVFPFEWDIQVKKPFEVSNDNYSAVIIDWHPAKPIVISYLQINPQNIWYVWAESVIEEKVVGTIAQAIRSKLSTPGFTVRVKKYLIDKIATMEQVQESGQKAKDVVQMLREFGIYCEIGNPSFGPAHTFLCDKMKHREFYIDPSCSLHIEQFDTWGAKRYQKGNLEGTLRDQLEVEGNDTCINMVYAYNAGCKFLNAVWEDQVDNYVHPRANRGGRLYGRAM